MNTNSRLYQNYLDQAGFKSLVKTTSSILGSVMRCNMYKMCKIASEYHSYQLKRKVGMFTDRTSRGIQLDIDCVVSTGGPTRQLDIVTGHAAHASHPLREPRDTSTSSGATPDTCLVLRTEGLAAGDRGRGGNVVTCRHVSCSTVLRTCH